MKQNREYREESSESKLEILLETIRIGSISKAAEQLNYTQSGLTYLLNTLEAELGLPLLKRDHRGVSFTDEGNQLAPYIRSLVDLEKSLRSKARELAGIHTERIRIGTTHSFAKYCLPHIIMKYKEQYPNSHIDFQVCRGSEIPVMVHERDLDIGIADIVQAGTLDCIPLWSEQIYVAVPSAWNLSPPDGIVNIDTLLDHPMIFLPKSPNNAGILVMKEKNVQKNIMVTSDGDTIMSMIEAGLGFAMLSKRYSVDCSHHVQMYPTSPPISRTIGVMARSLKDLRPLAKKFVVLLQEYDA